MMKIALCDARELTLFLFQMTKWTNNICNSFQYVNKLILAISELFLHSFKTFYIITKSLQQ